MQQKLSTVLCRCTKHPHALLPVHNPTQLSSALQSLAITLTTSSLHLAEMTMIKPGPVVEPRRSTRRPTRPRRYTPPMIRPTKVTPPKVRLDKKFWTHPPSYMPPGSLPAPYKGSSNVHDGRFDRYSGMLWLDDKHVIRPGVVCTLPL